MAVNYWLTAHRFEDEEPPKAWSKDLMETGLFGWGTLEEEAGTPCVQLCDSTRQS